MSRTIAKFASVLNGVQNYAQRLYSAISSGCTDGCHLEHETRLYLQTRSSEMNTKHQKPQNLKQTPLSFLITFSPRPVSSHPEFLGNKYQVRVLEEDLDQFDERQVDSMYPVSYYLTLADPQKSRRETASGADKST
jgi:hypothetical protein